MKRREFITLVGGAAAWPIAARAQQPNGMRRVGVLMNYAATQPLGQSVVAAFVEGLRQLGWIEGQGLRIDIRWNAGDAGLARIYAAQLIGLMPDVILASSTTNLRIVQEATSAVPVVFLQVTDPVAQGFVASLSHPGGNITGFTDSDFSIGGKWLDLLKKVAPATARIAVMFNPETSPQSKLFMQAIEAAAQSLDVQVSAMPVRTPADIEPALANFALAPNGGLILTTDSFTRLRWAEITTLAARFRLPSICQSEIFAESGGLMAYGATVNEVAQFRQAAGYVGRILRGAKPSDLPVQMADKFRFVINLKTAKALGIEVPPGLLASADEVVE
jgi:putative tryptophan/tyrosine transport system substrate-binding protein